MNTRSSSVGDLCWRGWRRKGPGGFTSRLTRLAISVAVVATSAVPALAQQPQHTRTVTSVTWSPNGGLAASGSEDKTVRDWKGGNARVLFNAGNGDGLSHAGRVNSVAYSPDGRLLASGSEDRTVNLWEVSTGKVRYTIKVANWANSPVRAVLFSPDGRYLYTGMGNGRFLVWDTRADPTADGPVLNVVAHNAAISSIAISADGKIVATGGLDSKVKVWKTPTQENRRGVMTWRLRSQASFDHVGEVRGVALSADGKFVAAGAETTRANGLRAWDWAANDMYDIGGHDGDVNAVSFTAVSNTVYLASGGHDGKVRLWKHRAAQGNTPERFMMLDSPGFHNGAVRSLAFSPDGSKIVSGGEDAAVKFYSRGD